MISNYERKSGIGLACCLMPVGRLTEAHGFVSATCRIRVQVRDATHHALIPALAGEKDGKPFDWQPESGQKAVERRRGNFEALRNDH